MTFEEWLHSCDLIDEMVTHDYRASIRHLVKCAWNKSKALSTAQSAAEIAALRAEAELLKADNEALRRDAANASRFIQMTAKQ